MELDLWVNTAHMLFSEALARFQDEHPDRHLRVSRENTVHYNSSASVTFFLKEGDQKGNIHLTYKRPWLFFLKPKDEISIFTFSKSEYAGEGFSRLPVELMSDRLYGAIERAVFD